MWSRRQSSRWSANADRRRSSLSRFAMLGGILSAGAIAALCFLYVWQENRLQELTAATEEARIHLESAHEINRILNVRIEESFSLERIARIARDQLGMSEPTVIRYVPYTPSDTN